MFSNYLDYISAEAREAIYVVNIGSNSDDAMDPTAALSHHSNVFLAIVLHSNTSVPHRVSCLPTNPYSYSKHPSFDLAKLCLGHYDPRLCVFWIKLGEPVLVIATQLFQCQNGAQTPSSIPSSHSPGC